MLSNDPLQDKCFAFSHLPVLSSLFRGLKFLPVSGVWWLLWIICSSHPLPALDWITLAKDVCKVTGARSPGAEPRGTAHSALILPKRRGLSSGYPSWQAGLSKHGLLSPLFLSLVLQMPLSLACSELHAWFWDLKRVLTWDRCCLGICCLLVHSQSPFNFLINLYLFSLDQMSLACIFPLL